MKRSRSIASLAVASAIAAALLLAPSGAAAQEPDPVSARGKGIAGGVLLGAEVVMIPIAIAGVKDWWPYVVFGAVGAGGGAVGGYFVEQVAEAEGATGPAEPSLYMLAGGLALVIPTVVAVLNATAYDPEEDEEVGEEGDEGGETPSVEPEGTVSGQAETGSRRRIPLALFDVDGSGPSARLRVGVPAVAVTPLYSPREVSMYGARQGTEVTVPVVRGAF